MMSSADDDESTTSASVAESHAEDSIPEVPVPVKGWKAGSLREIVSSFITDPMVQTNPCTLT
jgi:hypothetical protein